MKIMRFLVELFSYFLGTSFYILLSLLCRVIFHLLLYIEKKFLLTRQGPPYESLGPILSHLPDCIDRCHFRAVCKSWLLAEKEYPSPDQQLPWLIASTDYIWPWKVPCYSICSKKVYWIRFPTQAYCATRHGSSLDGWLLMGNGAPPETYLFNVFSSMKISVPILPAIAGVNPLPPEFMRPFNLLGWLMGPCFIHKMIVRSSPTSDDCLIAALGNFGSLSLCKPLTKSWTTELDNNTESLEDIIFYQQMVFGIDKEEQIVAFKVEETLEGLPYVTDILEYSTVRNVHIDDPMLERPGIYLAEHCGKLLMVLRYGEADERFGIGMFWKTTHLRVFELDDTKSPSEWVHVTSLGKFAMFLGSGGVQFFPTSDLEFIAHDCIYFAIHFDRKCSLRFIDRGVYSMRDGSIKQLDNIDSCLRWGSKNWLPCYSDMWLFPSKYKN
ncbi:hypothetical protein LUZ63_011692 [Rhynchospora breviuscula]|uniref:KIB1-4 beta-propeller domain-containing protein n=1 Tax=Rhynchospora breviuscula TaxID=2022672 RepID=A0A9Q0HQS5_9POAL|nr:hypothetical protein LUZ63_011692 [Rhynchospora breviuscula]